MKIILISPRYNISGVPLAQVRLARAFAKLGHDVILAFLFVDQPYALPKIPNVKTLNLHKSRVLYSTFSLAKIFFLEKPDIIFTAEDHLTLIALFALICVGGKAKLSGSSRVSPYDREAYFSPGGKGFFMKLAMKLLSWRATALTCVSKDMVVDYEKIFGITKRTYAYNIVVDSESDKLIKQAPEIFIDFLESKNIPIIVTAGRLDYEKGVHDLIVAISIILKKREVKLLILGDGAQRKNLERLIAELNINQYVLLAGYVINPFPFFKKSDIFVLPSYGEGMPNVLIEAMMCGCTPVSTDCPTGPSEVLQNGRYGYLVPVKSPVSLALAIQYALEHPIQRCELEKAIQPFHERAVIKRHAELLEVSF